LIEICIFPPLTQSAVCSIFSCRAHAGSSLWYVCVGVCLSVLASYCEIISVHHVANWKGLYVTQNMTLAAMQICIRWLL